MRALIDRIVIHPGDKKGRFTLELHGQLATILRVAQGQALDDPECMERLVAGAGFGRVHTFDSQICIIA